jgi:hypothetical protein
MEEPTEGMRAACLMAWLSPFGTVALHEYTEDTVWPAMIRAAKEGK